MNIEYRHLLNYFKNQVLKLPTQNQNRISNVNMPMIKEYSKRHNLKMDSLFIYAFRFRKVIVSNKFGSLIDSDFNIAEITDGFISVIGCSVALEPSTVRRPSSDMI